MSKYRLTEEQAEELDLQEITWDDVVDEGYDEIYIRAHYDAPIYGPYKVLDPDDFVICRIDGTGPRRYPRNDGLYVPKSDMAVEEAAPSNYVYYSDEDSPSMDFFTPDKYLSEQASEVIEDLLEDVKKELAILEEDLVMITERIEKLKLQKKVLFFLL